MRGICFIRDNDAIQTISIQLDELMIYQMKLLIVITYYQFQPLAPLGVSFSRRVIDQCLVLKSCRVVKDFDRQTDRFLQL